MAYLMIMRYMKHISNEIMGTYKSQSTIVSSTNPGFFILRCNLKKRLFRAQKACFIHWWSSLCMVILSQILSFAVDTIVLVSMA